MLSPEEVKVLDVNAEFFGVPPSSLMAHAGQNVAEVINDRYEPNRVLICCGMGNNGGDGFVASRHLAKTCDRVTVLLLDDQKNIKTQLSQDNFKKLATIGHIKVATIGNNTDVNQLIEEHQVIVDAMLGIGIAGEPREPYASVVKAINASGKPVVAVDVPTGIGSKTAVKPDITVTFHDKKSGMSKSNSGEILVVDIGIPEKAQRYVGPGELVVYYPRSATTSHKGDNGRVLVVGGGPYVGAPALAGLAALRAGADLVYIAAPVRAARALTSFSPNLIVHDLTAENHLVVADVPHVEKMLDDCDAVVIGPGLGRAEETRKTIKQIINQVVQQCKPLVVDADAIEVVGSNTDIVADSNTVVTPHAGEFQKLTGEKISGNIDNRRSTVASWAQKLAVTILLKSVPDIVSNGEESKFNEVHNAAMTVGGTGDVLSGIVGALLSKGVRSFDAARIGVFLNGFAGNKVFKQKSYGLLATDIIEELPSALCKYLK